MSTNLAGATRKALLVIANPWRRKLRANAFRDVGIDVICAGHIGEARELWHPAVFDLVVIDMKLHNQDAVALCADIQAEAPKQRIAWFVGSPEFLSATPLAGGNFDVTSSGPNAWRQAITTACTSLPRRGGFLEACWRMELGRKRLRSPQKAGPLHLPPGSPEPQRTIGEEGRSGFGEAVRQAEAKQGREP